MRRLMMALALLVPMLLLGPLQARANSCGAPAPILNTLAQVTFAPELKDWVADYKVNLNEEAVFLAETDPSALDETQRAEFFAWVEGRTAQNIEMVTMLAEAIYVTDRDGAEKLMRLAGGLQHCTAEKRTQMLQALADPTTQPALLELVKAAGMAKSFATDCGLAIGNAGVLPEVQGTEAFYAQCATLALQHAARNDAGHFKVMHTVATPLCIATTPTPREVDEFLALAL